MACLITKVRANGNTLKRVAIIIEENPLEETSPRCERLSNGRKPRYMHFQEKFQGILQEVMNWILYAAASDLFDNLMLHYQIE